MKRIAYLLILSVVLFSCKNNNEESNEFKPIKIVVCDAENVSPDSSLFVPSSRLSSLTFNDARSQSAEQAHTGRYSAKLNKNRPYGFTYKMFNIQANDSLQVTVWRYSPEKIGNLVVSSQDASLYYVSQSVGEEKDNYGWEKLTINAVVPEKAANQTLLVYCWNPDTVNTVYFDDLTISYLNKK